MIISISKAIEELKKNHVVAIPTETVYGLAARISSESALRLIFSTKKRPFFDPLIVHVCSIDQAKNVSNEWSYISQTLAEKFWPGPLTLVVPKNSMLISDLITSGLPSVGLRCPNHPIALELIQSVGEPLAAPSANLFGHTSPSEALHVETEFQNQIPVVDGGSCQIGIESTVLLIQGNFLSVLRPGHVTKNDIEICLNERKIKFQWRDEVEKKSSPGHMKHHYMPAKPLFGVSPQLKGDLIERINQTLSQLPDSVEGVVLKKPKKVLSVQKLVLPKHSEQAARLLYSELRKLETGPGEAIVFEFESHHLTGDWDAIVERIQKACSAILES